jgi:hypothetical protein
MIISLGWGSLIWCQKNLPVRGNWNTDGPELPVEFARESRDKRITLVLCDGHPGVHVLWAELTATSLAEAKQALAAREGVRDRYISNSIGYWSPDGTSNHVGGEAIGEWASQRKLTGVVWTALKPKIGDDYRTPSQEEVIGHLNALEGLARETAEEYVRLAPRQIITPYRTAIEAALGWTPTGLV